MTYFIYKCRMCSTNFSKRSSVDFGSGLYRKTDENQLFASHNCSAGAWGLADLIGEKENTAEEEFGTNPTTGTDYDHA